MKSTPSRLTATTGLNNKSDDRLPIFVLNPPFLLPKVPGLRRMWARQATAGHGRPRREGSTGIHRLGTRRRAAEREGRRWPPMAAESGQRQVVGVVPVQ